MSGACGVPFVLKPHSLFLVCMFVFVSPKKKIKNKKHKKNKKEEEEEEEKDEVAIQPLN